MELALKKTVDIIVDKIKPEKIILFGSKINEADTEDSDIDICILKENVEHRRKLSQNIYRLLYNIGLPVDILVETPERFSELKNNPYLIYHEIADKGEVIYDRARDNNELD